MKTKLLTICAVVTMILAVSGVAQGVQTWNVDASGGGDYTTIQSAISAASNGDTIQVAAGTYYANTSVGLLSVTKSLTFLGPNAGINPNTGSRVGEAVIVNDVDDEAPVQINNTQSVVMNGFTINSGSGDGGIWNRSTNSATLSYNVVNTSGARGITLEGGGNNINILHNQIYGETYGINIGSGAYSSVSINNNVIDSTDHWYGIFATGSADSAIDGLELNNNHFSALSNIAASVTSGEIMGNTFDMDLGFDGYYAIVAALHDSTVSENIFNGYGSADGINLWGTEYDHPASSNVLIEKNTFTDCGSAIQLREGDISDIVATLNNFNNCSIGLENESTNSASALANWWDNAAGPGVGDIIGAADASTWLDAPYPTGNVVPEPATMSLLAIGGLGALIRRRNRK